MTRTPREKIEDLIDSWRKEADSITNEDMPVSRAHGIRLQRCADELEQLLKDRSITRTVNNPAVPNPAALYTAGGVEP